MEILTMFYQSILFFLKLTIEPEVLWNVLPLFFATVLILVYFQRYADEEPGWNTHLTNILVLIFVSMSLFRYIYNIDAGGLVNFIDYSSKSIPAVLLLLVGSILLRFNFEHLLPEKIARKISSPLTMHLVAYAIILFVYSDLKITWIVVVSLILIILVLSAIFNLIKLPLRKLFIYIEKIRWKEKLEDVKESKYEIDELKRDLKEKVKDVGGSKKKLKRIDNELSKQLNSKKREVTNLKKKLKK